MNTFNSRTPGVGRQGGSRVRFLGLLVTVQVMAFVVCTLAMPALGYAATFSVKSTADIEDLDPGDGKCETAPPDSVCTLRAAIQEANALAGTDVIELPAGIYRLTLTGKGENAAATGDLNITGSLIITGAGANSTVIDGGVCEDPNDPMCTSESVRSDNDRVFSILNPGTNPIVNISGVTIQNGGGSSVNGGGVFISQGSSLSLTNCIVRENKSRQFGGGISNAGFLQIFQSTISDNTLPVGTLGGQTASGGGIFNFTSGSIQIDRSTISGNEAARGGGIRNAGGLLEITNSTMSGNKATARGGGIMNFGRADIAFSTITGNEANRRDIPVSGEEDRFGGGIYNLAAVDDQGVPSTVALGNTILAGNTDNRSRFDSNFSPDCFSKDPGLLTSFRGNLVGIVNQNCNMRDTIFGDTRFDLVGPVPCPTPEDPERLCPLDPRLGPLANNGGLTRTHALLSESPAIDQGTGVTSATFFDCPETDQRGLTRPVDGDGDGTADCDIGAFEFGAIPPEIVNNLVSLASKPVTSLSTIPTPDGPAGTFFITATFTNTSTISIRKPFFQVTELSGGNVLINADLGPGGVGATLTPNVGPDRLLTSGESITVEFRIGLQTRNPFTFVVDVMGEPS